MNQPNKNDILSFFENSIFGVMPSPPRHLKLTKTAVEPDYFAGKATLTYMDFRLEFRSRVFRLPAISVMPNSSKSCGVFIHINSLGDEPSRFRPSEEIIDSGYGFLSFCADDITKNDADFKDGICPILVPNRRKLNSCGKFSIWAWTAIRLCEYAESLPYVDKTKIAVIGHGHLGVSALIAGVYHQGFTHTIANSPCISVFENLEEENLSSAVNNYRHCLCPKALNSFSRRINISYGIVDFLSLITPRGLAVGNAISDLETDIEKELESVSLLSNYYENYGFRPLPHWDFQDKTDISNGKILFHLRKGKPSLSRQDWQSYIKFINQEKEKI